MPDTVKGHIEISPHVDHPSIGIVDGHHSVLTFRGKDGKDILSFDGNGDITIRGEVATNNMEIVAGIEELLFQAGILTQRNLTKKGATNA